eukprot:TRINITY_DN27659_c0_g1_i1.p1 TRINITY_DN27659_c0_g1~~TRINITY_DN27659_c0_g1_i1.p1  ORF type:complete len:482 (+),score=46.30 TRINITY_DN27659_c0_g1_i1:60-1505(+)
MLILILRYASIILTGAWVIYHINTTIAETSQNNRGIEVNHAEDEPQPPTQQPQPPEMKVIIANDVRDTMLKGAWENRVITTFSDCRALKMLNAWLRSVELVRPKYQGIIIGALDDSIIQWCKERGVTHIDVRTLCPWIAKDNKDNGPRTATQNAIYFKPALLHAFLSVGIDVLFMDIDTIMVQDPWAHYDTLNPRPDLAMQGGERFDLPYGFKTWPNAGLILARAGTQAELFISIWFAELDWSRAAYHATLHTPGKAHLPRPYLYNNTGFMVLNFQGLMRKAARKPSSKKARLALYRLQTEISKTIVAKLHQRNLSLGDVIEAFGGGSKVVNHGGKTQFYSRGVSFGPLEQTEVDSMSRVAMPARFMKASGLDVNSYYGSEPSEQSVAREVLNFYPFTNLTYTLIHPPAWTFPHWLPFDDKGRHEQLGKAAILHVTGAYNLNGHRMRLGTGNMNDKYHAMERLGVIPKGTPPVPPDYCLKK